MCHIWVTNHILYQRIYIGVAKMGISQEGSSPLNSTHMFIPTFQPQLHLFPSFCGNKTRIPTAHGSPTCQQKSWSLPITWGLFPSPFKKKQGHPFKKKTGRNQEQDFLFLKGNLGIKPQMDAFSSCSKFPFISRDLKPESVLEAISDKTI